MRCTCPFCLTPGRPKVLYSTPALEWVIETRDNLHAYDRVYAYIELFHRAGMFDPTMPYLVWSVVMGDAPPPVSRPGIGAFKIQHDGGWAQALRAR